MENLPPQNPQNNPPTGVPGVAPMNPPIQTPKIPTACQFKANIGPLIKDVFGKFYQNKKAFYLVAGLLGLILLITIAGVIYKMSGSLSSKEKVTPTPASTVQTTTVNEENLTPLEKMENDLKAV